MAKDDDKRTLTPKLRFPEFRNALGWKDLPFGDLYRFKRTNTFSRDELNYKTGTIRNIHYGDIHTRFQALFDVSKEIVPFVTPSDGLDDPDENAFCSEGDIVFADASEDLADVGKCIEIVALHGERVLSGTHTILATRTDSRLIVGFGGHLFHSGRIRAQIKREAQGSKVFGISAGRISGIGVCFPHDKKEQKKIADCLSSLDELIAAEGRKLEALKAHKKGLMQQLFPRPGETRPRPRLRFPEFQDAPEWDERDLGSICRIQRGKFSHRPRNAPKFFNGQYPFIQTGDVVRAKGGSVVASQSLNELGLSMSKLFSPTIVLITIAANIGDTAILDSEACFTDSVVGLIPIADSVTPRFLEPVLRLKKDYLNSVATTGAQKNINNEILSALTILMPTLAEQQRIAACLSSLDAVLAGHSQKLAALRTHKQALMQQLFPSPEEAEA